MTIDLEHPAALYVFVLLNGLTCKYVLAASEDEGWVDRYKVNARGYADHDDGKIVHERIYGHVSIVVDPDSPFTRRGDEIVPLTRRLREPSEV